jgi:Yip1-like protein
MASATLQQAPEAPEKVNPFARMVGVIFSPKATFQSIARRPDWLVPLILLCIAECAVVGVYGQHVGWRGMLEKQLSNNEQFQQLKPDAQQERINTVMPWVSKIAYVEVIVGPFLAAFLFAGVFWLIFNMGAGAKIAYGMCLAIVSYALVPAILGSLLGVLIIFLKDPSTIDLQHLVASNVGALMSSDSPKALVAALRAVDLFLFWEMFLLAIGFAAAAPKKLSTGTAFAYIFGLWAFAVLCTAGIVAVVS